MSKDHQVADPQRTEVEFPAEAARLKEALATDQRNAGLWMEYGLALSSGMLIAIILSNTSLHPL